MLILTILVILAGVHLAITTQNIALKYKTTELKIKLSESKGKNRVLGVQVARQENLGIIEQKASLSLGMFYPAKMNYVIPKCLPSPHQN
jgi:hypothetical protein